MISRQHPGTASGALPHPGGRDRIDQRGGVARPRRSPAPRTAGAARLLAVYGVLERQGEVAHLIAGRLRDMTPLLGNLVTELRDFT